MDSIAGAGETESAMLDNAVARMKGSSLHPIVKSLWGVEVSGDAATAVWTIAGRPRNHRRPTTVA